MPDDNEIPMQLLLVPVRISSKAIAEFRNRKIKTQYSYYKKKRKEKYRSKHVFISIFYYY